MKTVVIDPGHGGNDPGAVNGSTYEKDKALIFAKELAAQLKAAGAEPVLTRTEDKAVTLNYRTALEQLSGAACCISCHMDAGQPSASGMTAWVHSSAGSTITAWAADVIADLKAVGFTSNRYKEVNKGFVGNPNLDYAWNRDTKSPSMLLELGFITNADNLAEFDRNYKAYASAVARATCRFIGVKSEAETDWQGKYKEQKAEYDGLIAELRGVLARRT